MARRLALIAIILSSVVIGGVVVWFALTIPNDVRAEALLREAQGELRERKRDGAREKLEAIVRDYPRTDAAATALTALLRMANEDRVELERRLQSSETRAAEQTKKLTALEQRLTEVSKKASAPPQVAKPAPAKKPTVKRATKKPTRRTTRRPTRRRRG